MSEKHYSQRYQVVKESDSSFVENEIKKEKKIEVENTIHWHWLPLEKEITTFFTIIIWVILTIYMIYLSQSMIEKINQ